MKKLFVFLFIFASFEPLYCYEEPIFHVNDRNAGINYTVKDFYVYNYSESVLQGYARLYYSGTNYRQYVGMNIFLFKNGSLVGTKVAFADYETYGSHGMLPGTETYLIYYFDKVDFDSVFFNVSYNTSDGSKPWFNKDAITVINTGITSFSGSIKKVAGILKNLSRVTLKYPSVIICLYKNGKMLQYKMTFADAPDNSLESLQTATFYTYMDLPATYDSLKHVPTYSPSLTGLVIVSDVDYDIKNDIPGNFLISQNYPNPFNPVTTIKYLLPFEIKTKLHVFDLNGREVAILIDEKQSAGCHTVSWDASGLPSGIYYYSLEAGAFKEVKRALLLK